MHVILTHEHADFDAVASLLGAALLMPDAVPVLPRQVNRNVNDFLTIYGGQLPFVEPDTLPRRRIEWVTLVDTQSAQYPRGMGRKTRIQVIDHHALTRDDVEPGAYWGGNTGACTTLLVEEICRRNIDLTPIEATLLLLGIYEDTGSLIYAGTTPRDLHAAAWLLEQGANLEVAADFLHHPLSPAQRELYERLVDSAETHEFAGHAVVIATAEAPDFKDELSTVAHKIRNLLEPAALFVLVDLGEHIQMVARSTTDAVPVGQIAAAFGGGGHDRAAAAVIQDLSMQEVYHRLLQLLDEHIQPHVTVREIMSLGTVRTIEPDTTIAEAARQMRRYGHEGYPVVRDGQVLGILTRREVDRAMHHGLENAPAETYMHKGAVTISPNASVEELQKLMMEYDVGQIPVVDNGEMIGIVTRTDLLKLWGRPDRTDRAAEIMTRLRTALSPALLELLEIASAAADRRGDQLYIVGGFVRDLLLGVEHGPDIDLVVDGDAIGLARALQKEHGGRVRSHARFGTAKWILPDHWTSRRGVPNSLDFATARTEFYERPTALPSVERGSIKSDLRRRDFTINTMAISLNPDRCGELLDFFGGEADLERGLIRVLHNLSFVEDPTRILRAARLAERLGFEIEPRTRELIDDAVDLLDRVSGDRIRHELFASFEEKEPERVLARLHEMGALQAIHPALVCDTWLAEKFRRLRESLTDWYRMSCRPPGTRNDRPSPPSQPPTRPGPALYLALLTYRLDADTIEEIIKRLYVPSDLAGLLRQMPALRAAEEQLQQPELRRSDVYHALEEFESDALCILWVATDDLTVRERAELFQRELQCIEPVLDGHYLRELGVPPGPIYREVLTAVRDARLNQEAKTRADEEALILRILENRGVSKEEIGD
ncbi:MAG: CBS domain-containing protein [Chloroflexi bacterium]|nr:MAG: CBS domain-containing protein [Chloroflexota bacterium]